MLTVSMATAFGVLFVPQQPAQEKKPTAVWAVDASESMKVQRGKVLGGALNVRQNCAACHSPTPDNKALVCPKGHGAYNVIEYIANDALNPAYVTFNPVSAAVSFTSTPASKLGLTLKPVGDGLRTHLKLAADAGVLVEEVAKESVLADADVKKYDVLVAVDDTPAKEPDKVVDLILSGVKENKELSLSLVRRGTPKVSKIHLTPTLVARLVDAPKQGETRYRIGVSLAGVDETLRQHLKIPNGEGAVVTSVESGGAASEAQIKQHDILLRWGQAPITGSEGLIEIIQKNGPKPAKVSLYRDGEKAAMTITPKPLTPPAEVVQFHGELANRLLVQQTDHDLIRNLYVANVNVDFANASLEGELAAALAQTKALQASLERLQAKVKEAEKKAADKPPAKK